MNIPDVKIPDYRDFKAKPLMDKIHTSITFFIRLSVIVAIAGSIMSSNWIVLFISLVMFLLTFLPSLFEKRYAIYLPVEFELAIIIFLYASIFLGEVHRYYTIFWWWDIVLHTGSGIALGIAGFLIVYVLYAGNKIKASPLFIAVFSFCFAVAIGAVWEIFEFSMDQFFGLNMQKSGLLDTMWDLIVDSVGALLVSFLGYVYIRGGDTRGFERLISKFSKENPRLFEDG